MMMKLDRLPKRRGGGDQKVWDLSLLSPEQQDRVDELSRVIMESKDLHSKSLDTVFAEFDQLVRDLPRLGPNDLAQGPLIEVPGALARHWEFQHGASKWRPHDFGKLGKVQTLRFVELCEKYGFTDGTETPVKAQMLPLHGWPSGDRAELQHLLDIAASPGPIKAPRPLWLS
jgi:hypothetical protein